MRVAQVEDKKKKEKQSSQTEKYYKNKKADFTYLHQFGYKIYKELGRGGYGVVYKACRYRNGIEDKSQKFAIKMNFMTVTPELIYSEIAFLSLVKDKDNLPQLEDLIIINNKIHIILRYFKYKPFISFFSEFQMEDIKCYLYELLKGIKALKDIGIFHRDVKPGNFLYNPETKEGCLIDFGLSELDSSFVQRFKLKVTQETDPVKKKEMQQKGEYYNNIMRCIKLVGNNKIGTESFMPLESILRYSTQSYSVDIWPVGVIFLQFVLRKYNIFNNVQMINKPPDLKNNYFINFIMELAQIFGTNEVTKQCFKYNYKVSFPKDIPKEPRNFRDIVKIDGFDKPAEDLLKRLLALDQSERISVEKALDHVFFNSVREQQEQSLEKRKYQKLQQQHQQQQSPIKDPQQPQQQQQQQYFKSPKYQQQNLQQPIHYEQRPQQIEINISQQQQNMNLYQQQQFQQQQQFDNNMQQQNQMQIQQQIQQQQFQPQQQPQYQQPQQQPQQQFNQQQQPQQQQ